MRLFALTIGFVLVVAAPGVHAASVESRFERSLKMLEPGERLVQLCDYTAMQRIRKEAPGYRPDRAIADAATPTRIRDNQIEAPGAAFRSRGKWYAMTYHCTASPDNMKVLSFSYRLGDEIPENKWHAYGLWD